jgi:EAL domain-containing protein (putative c-di-GMP-specific phosphodiesterase class I)
VQRKSGLILQLGRWAMHKAARRLPTGTIRGVALPLIVGVNLSAIQVARDDVARLCRAPEVQRP